MSKLLPIIGGITGTVAIGGTGAYFLTTQNTKTFKEEFSHSLILLNGEGDSLLNEKLKLLHANEVKSDNAKLKDAKSKATGADNKELAELKLACQEIYESKFDNRGSNIFKDFQSFCSKNIKDEITSAKWAPTVHEFNWAPKLQKLKEPNKVLVDSLRTIANKQEGTKDKDLKGWCESIQNSIFEGTENNTFKNANEFCTK